MLEFWNHRLFELLTAPNDLSGPLFVPALLLAQWAIYAAPCALALLWIFGAHRDRHAAVAAALTVVLALVAARATSSLVMHPRPFMDANAHNYLNHRPDSSFPSDHAVILFALAFALLQSGAARARRLSYGMFLLAVATGWARVFLNAHYPFDIVGSIGLGLVCAWIMRLRWGREASDRLTVLGERVAFSVS